VRAVTREQTGQAVVLGLALLAALLLGLVVLVAFGQAVGGKSHHQRAADLAAVSAGASMRDDYARLFEPPLLANGLPNPRHLSASAYLARARGAAVRAGRRNGVRISPRDVVFPAGFAPTRVTVSVRGAVAVRTGGREARRIAVQAKAGAELDPGLGLGFDMPGFGSGGGYDGPLAYRMGKPMRPDVAEAFDRMAAAASRDGIALSINSGFRSDDEQARLFKANPDPRWVAPPGTSLHRYGTELDLGSPGAYAWLKANHRRFGFIHRYAWEPWHYGFGANPRDRAHPAQYNKGSFEPPGGDHGRIKHRLPSFVPPRFHDPIAGAALRFNVPMNLLAAQLYAESGFNPFAQSPVGAQGIAQFMPGTARAYGLNDPFDPEQAILAQARLMSDLLKQFDGKPSLALAAYNAGPAAVQRYGGVPPFAETRGYVSKIIGLLGGAGEISASSAVFKVRLVE